jgi:hypothetical protein
MRNLRRERCSGEDVLIVRKELQGDKAVQLHILGPVDHTHTTAAEPLNDAVVRDGLADQIEPRAASQLPPAALSLDESRGDSTPKVFAGLCQSNGLPFHNPVR